MDSIDHSSWRCYPLNPVFRRIYGGRVIYFTLMGDFCYSLNNVLFRYVEDSVSTVEAVCLNRIFIMLFVVPTLIYLGQTPKVDTKEKLLLLSVAPLSHTGAVILFFFGLTHMKAGDVAAISLTSPVFVGIFGRIFLKEAFDFIDLLLAIVNLAGVVLIAQPSFIFGDRGGDHVATMLAPLAVLLSSVLYATTFLSVRRMGTLGVSSFVIILYSSVLGSVFTAVMTALVNEGWTIPPCGSERYALVGMGVTLFCGQCLIIYSFSQGKAFLVSILNTNEIIFSYLLEFALIGVVPDVIALLGALLIMSASIMVPVKRTDWFQSVRTCRSGRSAHDEPTEPYQHQLEETSHRIGEHSDIHLG